MPSLLHNVICDGRCPQLCDRNCRDVRTTSRLEDCIEQLRKFHCQIYVTLTETYALMSDAGEVCAGPTHNGLNSWRVNVPQDDWSSIEAVNLRFSLASKPIPCEEGNVSIYSIPSTVGPCTTLFTPEIVSAGLENKLLVGRDSLFIRDGTFRQFFRPSENSSLYIVLKPEVCFSDHLHSVEVSITGLKFLPHTDFTASHNFVFLSWWIFYFFGFCF